MLTLLYAYTYQTSCIPGLGGNRRGVVHKQHPAVPGPWQAVLGVFCLANPHLHDQYACFHNSVSFTIRPTLALVVFPGVLMSVTPPAALGSWYFVLVRGYVW